MWQTRVSYVDCAYITLVNTELWFRLFKLGISNFWFRVSDTRIAPLVGFRGTLPCFDSIRRCASLIRFCGAIVIYDGYSYMMARTRSLLLHFHSVTTTWWYKCRSICRHFHHKRNYTHERITNHKTAPPNSLAPHNRMRGAHLRMESKQESAPQNPTRGAILVLETLN